MVWNPSHAPGSVPPEGTTDGHEFETPDVVDFLNRFVVMHPGSRFSEIIRRAIRMAEYAESRPYGPMMRGLSPLVLF